ncbi:MAG TPA: AAA family ATPase [Steroidobacteraceae bacterium]|jgi:type II secretory pathway predicted ATPase ExeA
MNQKLLALYGLKWNPFSPEVPTEALLVSSKIDSFCWRVEHGLLREGGFALITGDPGSGKSVVLRLLAERLGQQHELVVAALSHPSSRLGDLYRELGELFGVALRPHNRWGGFKTLRERWLSHLHDTQLRPVLLIDEAQELLPSVLAELRLLASTQFDSRTVLSVVLAGDGRLSEKLRRDELLPLGSRIRLRLAMDYASSEELNACLTHLLERAGNPTLMTEPLKATLCDHAAGNYRALTTIAANLLTVAAERNLAQLDEKLYFEVFAPEPRKPRRAGARP